MKLRIKKIFTIIACVLVMSQSAYASTEMVGEAIVDTKILRSETFSEGDSEISIVETIEGGDRFILKTIKDSNNLFTVKLYKNGVLIQDDKFDLAETPAKKDLSSSMTRGTTYYTWTQSTDNYDYRIVSGSVTALGGVIAAMCGIPADRAFTVAYAVYGIWNEMTDPTDRLYFTTIVKTTQVTIDGSYTYYIHRIYTDIFIDAFRNDFLDDDYWEYESLNIMP